MSEFSDNPRAVRARERWLNDPEYRARREAANKKARQVRAEKISGAKPKKIKEWPNVGAVVVELLMDVRSVKRRKKYAENPVARQLHNDRVNRYRRKKAAEKKTAET